MKVLILSLLLLLSSVHTFSKYTSCVPTEDGEACVFRDPQRYEGTVYPVYVFSHYSGIIIDKCNVSNRNAQIRTIVTKITDYKLNFYEVHMCKRMINHLFTHSYDKSPIALDSDICNVDVISIDNCLLFMRGQISDHIHTVQNNCAFYNDMYYCNMLLCHDCIFESTRCLKDPNCGYGEEDITHFYHFIKYCEYDVNMPVMYLPQFEYVTFFRPMFNFHYVSEDLGDL
jgi:hypothetical protein